MHRICKHIIFYIATALLGCTQLQAQETTDTVPKPRELGGVTVNATSATQKSKQQPVTATVVNARAAYEQSATLTELMNRSAGVRLRQAGGLGAATDVSINGFQGKAIRYLKDGIPVDYLRDGFNIASLPVNTLERVEIYKGVLPVSLGADALGGAVNLISRRSQPKYVAASYEVASFNTHRITLNGYYSDPAKKWFVAADAFYNYSDNNYKAKVKVTDPVTSNQVYDRVPLFHNRFNNMYGEVSGGVTNRSWADELKISVAAFYLHRQQNHPALMTDPYGAITGKQSSVVPSLRYKKTLLDGSLSVDQFLVHNTVTVKRTDTLAGRYDWYGNFYPISGRIGESRQPALSTIDYTNTTSRTYIKYKLSQQHTLELNNVFTALQQQGTDPYGPRLDGTDIMVISLPASYQKSVTGAGLTSVFLEDKLETRLMAKFYHYRSSGTEAWQSRPITKTDAVTQSGNNWGTAVAAKYALTSNSFVRLSAELANRLPDQEELFGDGIWTVPNFALSPERSLNINLGYRLTNTRNNALEVNTFYRRTEDLILLIPVQAPYAQYQNIRNVKGFGLEADGLYHLNPVVSINGNFTWQDIRLFKLSSATDQWQNKARLRNTPYFFANAGITAQLKKLLLANDQLKVYSYYNFVKAYYLETIPKRLEPSGFLGLFGRPEVNTALIIPDQHLWSAGFYYAPYVSKLSFGFEVKNILNQDLYDNYRVQKAGRSFHFKINYTIQ
jgi:outer membrane receptor protein involved in Fe transport